MKKYLIIILAAIAPVSVFADAATDEILGRYNASLGKAQSFCSALPEQIGRVKLMSGISLGATAVGTIGGGAAVATGIIKWNNDKKIDGMVDPAVVKARAEELQTKAKDRTITPQEADELVLLAKHIKDDKEKFPQAEKDLKDAKDHSNTMGNVRTAGAFVSGAGGAVGAATSLGSLKTLDDLITYMNACDSYVNEIDKQLMELRFAEPDNPAIAKMNAVVNNCKGMSSKNIADIKGKLKVGGVISAVGGAAGILGGITSMMAKNGASATGAEGKESTKGLNMAANISSGVASVGNLGGAIISGVALSGLMKNGDIAKKCAESF
ncbi:MAG: hypothetical protein LBT45_02595 [Rickettsiales bacterium]|jgi:hypothetical protein|nr:hypothetical protein [Rickettsiales bacterium]